MGVYICMTQNKENRQTNKKQTEAEI